VQANLFTYEEQMKKQIQINRW